MSLNETNNLNTLNICICKEIIFAYLHLQGNYLNYLLNLLIFSKAKQIFGSFSKAEKKFEYLLNPSYSNNALALALIISLTRPPISDTFDNAVARLTAT